MSHDDNIKIIAFVGLTGSGKSAAVDYVVKKGHPKVYFGGVVLDAMTAAGLGIIYGFPYITKAVPSPLVTIVVLLVAALIWGATLLRPAATPAARPSASASPTAASRQRCRPTKRATASTHRCAGLPAR